MDAFLASGGVHFDVVGTVWSVGINFGIAVASYFGFWRGSAVANKAAESGIK